MATSFNSIEISGGQSSAAFILIEVGTKMHTDAIEPEIKRL